MDPSERKCGYCKGPHPVSAEVAEESPFCTACLHDRIERRQKSDELTVTVLDFEARIAVLEEDYIRAKGPKARKRIQAKIDKTRSEVEKLKSLAATVDLTAANWLRSPQA